MQITDLEPRPFPVAVTVYKTEHLSRRRIRKFCNGCTGFKPSDPNARCHSQNWDIKWKYVEPDKRNALQNQIDLAQAEAVTKNECPIRS